MNEHNKSLLEAADEVQESRNFFGPQTFYVTPNWSDVLQNLRGAIDPEQQDEFFSQLIALLPGMPPMQRSRCIADLAKASGLTTTEIRTHIKESQNNRLTHGDMAAILQKRYGDDLVGCYGTLWMYSEATGIWERLDFAEVEKLAHAMFNDQQLCRRESDYRAIGKCLYNRVADETFFSSAPCGIVTPSGFLCVTNRSIQLLAHSRDHRAIHAVRVDPDTSKEPQLLLAALRRAFGDCHAEAQIRQLQMLAGLGIFGMQHKLQIAALLYGAAAGFKSSFLQVLRAMVPESGTCCVSPLDLDQEYQRAALAGKRLNLAPELDRDKPIPSAGFKSVLGGDLIGARNPYGQPFTFSATCGNWFCGNYFPTTRDQSDGFWRRWAIVHFVHSVPAAARDPDLVQKICANELAAVLGWCLEGLEDYLEHGLCLSDAHFDQLQCWKNESNSVAAWLLDPDSPVEEVPPNAASLPTAETYEKYKSWCHSVGRQPFGKGQFKAHLIERGHAVTETMTGHRFQGLAIKSQLNT